MSIGSGPETLSHAVSETQQMCKKMKLVLSTTVHFVQSILREFNSTIVNLTVFFFVIN